MLLLAVVLTSVSIAWGYSSGLVPTNACESGPRHGSAAQNTFAPFRIATYHSADGTVATDYTPGEELRGNLK